MFRKEFYFYVFLAAVLWMDGRKDAAKGNIQNMREKYQKYNAEIKYRERGREKSVTCSLFFSYSENIDLFYVPTRAMMLYSWMAQGKIYVDTKRILVREYVRAFVEEYKRRGFKSV